MPCFGMSRRRTWTGVPWCATWWKQRIFRADLQILPRPQQETKRALLDLLAKLFEWVFFEWFGWRSVVGERFAECHPEWLIHSEAWHLRYICIILDAVHELMSTEAQKKHKVIDPYVTFSIDREILRIKKQNCMFLAGLAGCQIFAACHLCKVAILWNRSLGLEPESLRQTSILFSRWICCFRLIESGWATGHAQQKQRPQGQKLSWASVKSVGEATAVICRLRCADLPSPSQSWRSELSASRVQ